MKFSPLRTFGLCILFSATIGWSRDLTGTWQSDGIGTAMGTYFIRVAGQDVFWLGESGDGGKSWNNVFHGTLKDNVIKGKWADLPIGTGGSYGTLELQYEPATDTIVLNTETGYFSGRKWIRVEKPEI